MTYSNELKTGILGVREETLKQHGAVSEQCVLEMAAGARERAGADLAIATSGVAGPDGGTAEHPVGTVCIGLVGSNGTQAARRYQLRGNRDWIKILTGTGRAGLAAPLRAGTADRRIDAVPPLTPDRLSAGPCGLQGNVRPRS